MDVFLAVIGVLSFLLAVVGWFQMARRKDRELVNLTLMNDRLDHVARSLEATYGAVDTIVKVARTPTATVDELANLARVARQHVLVTAQGLNRSEDLVTLWRSGRNLSELTAGDRNGIFSGQGGDGPGDATDEDEGEGEAGTPGG